MYTTIFEKICCELKDEKPVVYFTSDGSQKECDGVKCGYYEIRKSSFGPIMLRLEYANWNRLGGRFEMAWKDYGFFSQKYNTDFYSALRLIGCAHVEPSEMSVETAKNLFNDYTETRKKTETKIAEPVKGITALDSFEAFARVLNRHRPYEPSDFIPESFTPNIKDRQR